jgi:hypothetical protein
MKNALSRRQWLAVACASVVGKWATRLLKCGAKASPAATRAEPVPAVGAGPAETRSPVTWTTFSYDGTRRLVRAESC